MTKPRKPRGDTNSLKNFAWNARRDAAAVEVAKDLMTDAGIAREAGVTAQQLRNWRKCPEFAARVQEHRDYWAQQIKDRGLIEKENRIKGAQDDYVRTEIILRERANDPAMQRVPGGRSGYLVRQVKQIGAGAKTQTVEEYVFDKALFASRIESRMYVAKELGQWVEKSEFNIRGELEKLAPLLATEFHRSVEDVLALVPAVIGGDKRR